MDVFMNGTTATKSDVPVDTVDVSVEFWTKLNSGENLMGGDRVCLLSMEICTQKEKIYKHLTPKGLDLSTRKVLQLHVHVHGIVSLLDWSY